MGKRGSAHFEMIVSFIFFTGFVFFLFITLKPTDTSTLSSSVITGLRDSFEDEVYTNLSNVFLKVDNLGGENCFYIGAPGEIFNYKIIEDKSRVTTLGGDEIVSDLEKLGVNWRLKIRHGNERAFRIAFSPEFTDGEISTGGCNVELTSDEYEIGSVVERQVVSYKALNTMKNKYYDTNGGYNDLKIELGIPPIFDFAIVSETLTEINMEQDIPSVVDVIAEDYVFGVLNSTGGFVNERFSFRIW